MEQTQCQHENTEKDYVATLRGFYQPVEELATVCVDCDYVFEKEEEDDEWNS